MDKHHCGCTFSVHCSYENAKDNVVIVLLMCLRHPGWCTTTDVSLVTVWAHHEYSCAGRGPEHTSLWQQYEERKRLLGSPSCETTTTVMEILDGFSSSSQELRGRKGEIAAPLQRFDTYFTLKTMLISSPVLRQQIQLFITARCTSAKSLKCLEQRTRNTSVTNGFWRILKIQDHCSQTV